MHLQHSLEMFYPVDSFHSAGTCLKVFRLSFFANLTTFLRFLSLIIFGLPGRLDRTELFPVFLRISKYMQR